MKHLLPYKLFENNTDYSGTYNDLKEFIVKNNLQKTFAEKYNLKLAKWEDYVSGELGFDTEIIGELAGDDYRVYYNDDKDDITLTKKRKKKKINYDIFLSNGKYDSDIYMIINNAGVHTEFEARFCIINNNRVIGGSTYEIQDNVYHFDIAIDAEYQGYGISKELINKIIEDAKKLKTDGLSTEVINDVLFDYLLSIGFHGSKDSDVKYIYLDF